MCNRTHRPGLALLGSRRELQEHVGQIDVTAWLPAWQLASCLRTATQAIKSCLIIAATDAFHQASQPLLGLHLDLEWQSGASGTPVIYVSFTTTHHCCNAVLPTTSAAVCCITRHDSCLSFVARLVNQGGAIMLQCSTAAVGDLC